MDKSQIIKLVDGNLIVPNNPIIPYIEGDGIGADIWSASQFVFDESIKNNSGQKSINWLETLAEKSHLKKQVSGCLILLLKPLNNTWLRLRDLDNTNWRRDTFLECSA